MKSFPKTREILLDENLAEQEFIGIISLLYKQDCFIYAIIPNWEEELLNKLSSQFIKVKDIHLPRTFPRATGHVGYVQDIEKQFAYEFYLRSTTMDFVFSDIDVREQLHLVNKKNIDIYKIFETNKAFYTKIGPDGQWLEIVEYQ